MSTPIFSNVSLSKFERVFTALKNEADPYAAARYKNPFSSLLNAGTKKLFNYDYYEGQDAAADEFTAAVIDAWRQLAHDNSGERTFQIEDGSGTLRTVALQKNQDGSIDLVKKNAGSASVAEALLLGAAQNYSEPVIGLHRAVLTSPTKDNVIATVEADNVAVATAVIDTAVKYVKEQFQSVNPEYGAPLALVDNKKFQLRVAHEVLANANDNEPGIVAGALKHIIANGVQRDIVKAVSVLKEMVAKADRYKKEVIQHCALVLINERSIDDDLVKSMVGHIVANATKYDKGIAQGCALFVVREDKHNHFPKDIALAAVDILASTPEHLHGAPLVRMARIIIRHNHDFFSDPTKGQKSQEKIVALYESKGRMDAIRAYSKGFGDVLDAQKKKISVIWTDPSPRSGSIRHFVMGDVKHDKKARHPFYSENKVKQSDSPHTQILSLRSLWIQGDFEAAILADHGLARYIVEKRKDDALNIWNARHEV